MSAASWFGFLAFCSALTPVNGDDSGGIPLPAHARARLGTLQYRHIGFGDSAQASVRALAFSRDGKVFASLAFNGTIWMWDSGTGVPLRRFGRPVIPRRFDTIAFSADGRYLDSDVGTWEVATGRRPFGKGFEMLAFGSEGSTFAGVDDQWNLAIRELETGKLLRSLADHVHPLSMLFAGKRVVVGSSGLNTYIIRTWDSESGKELPKIEEPLGKMHSAHLAVSPDGRLVVSSFPKIRLYDLEKGRELFSLETGSSQVLFSPDGRSLASFEGPNLVLYEVATGRERARFHVPDVATDHPGLAFAPDGKTVLVGGHQGTIHIIDLSARGGLRPSLGHHGPVRQLAFTPDGNHLVSGAIDHTIRVWEVATGKELRRLNLDERSDPAPALALTPDGKSLAIADGKAVRLWDPHTGRDIALLKRNVETRDGEVRALAFSPDGKSLASQDIEVGAVLWDPTGNRKPRPFAGLLIIPPLVFSPDGRFLAGGSPVVCDRITELALPNWEPLTPRFRGDIRSTFAFPPRGETIALSCSFAPGAELQELATGKVVCRYPAKSGVEALAFSPDGKLLAGSESASADIVLWDAATGREQHRLTGHRDHVLCLAFAPDGKTLASGSQDTTILLWDLAKLAPPEQ